jgi:hypothetical protein
VPAARRNARGEHPQMSTAIELGDVFKIETPRGFAYLQSI